MRKSEHPRESVFKRGKHIKHFNAPSDQLRVSERNDLPNYNGQTLTFQGLYKLQEGASYLQTHNSDILANCFTP